MSIFPNPETIISIGNFGITWYIVSLILACIVSFLLLSKLMETHGYRQRTTDEVFALGLIGAIIGGRFGWIIENFHEFSLYGWAVFEITDGGMEVVTALLGVGLAIYWYCRHNHMSLFRTMDCASIVVVVASIIVKMGRCPAQPRLWINVIVNVVCLFIIWFTYHTYQVGQKRGDLTATVLLLMGVSRLMAYVFKLDTLAVNNIYTAILAEIGGLVLYYRNRKYVAPKPTLLFDFDGTLMDSEGMVIHCFMHLFEKYGNPEDFTHEKQIEVFGPPLHDEMKKLFPDRDPDVMVQEYRLYQNTLPGQHVVELLPNTEVVLRELKKQGYKMGIVSTRLTESCDMWLKELGIDDVFDVVLGRDKFYRPKPAPDGLIKACEMLGCGHDSCIYIGDNASDVMAAKAAGVYAVSYVSNEEKIDQIRAAKPNYLITELGQLIPELESNIHSWTYEKV